MQSGKGRMREIWSMGKGTAQTHGKEWIGAGPGASRFFQGARVDGFLGESERK